MFLQNTFANECFLELAAEADIHTFDLRLSILEDERGREMLERLQTLSKWGDQAISGGQRGRSDCTRPRRCLLPLP